MKTVEDLEALPEDTVVMTLESGSTYYYQKVVAANEFIYDRWVTLGTEWEYASQVIQARSGGKWAVVEIPVIE